MTKLSETQLALLCTASNRADGSLFPPADSVTARADHIRRSVEALIRKQLVHELETEDAGSAWRQDGGTCFGVVINDAGRTALAMLLHGEGPASGPAASGGLVPASTAASPSRPSKIGTVLNLLRRDEGATLSELVDATGWLPHTMRAALTGLRKKGHALDRRKRGDVTCYHAGLAA
jgi:hypothetical protein